LTTGDPAAAVGHLEQAVSVNVRLDNRPASTVSRAELAEAYLARAEPGDLNRARSLLAEAVTQARDLGLTRRAETWSTRLAALEPSTVPAVLRHRDEGWTVTGRGARFDLPDLVGLRYLNRLLEQPGHEFTAMELHVYQLLGGELQPDLVAGALARALGVDDETRELSLSPERARTAVRKAIKRAVDAIAEHDPVLGADLRASIVTGTTCRYTPGDLSWRVERD
jgi:hypothetical protein